MVLIVVTAVVVVLLLGVAGPAVMAVRIEIVDFRARRRARDYTDIAGTITSFVPARPCSFCSFCSSFRSRPRRRRLRRSLQPLPRQRPSSPAPIETMSAAGAEKSRRGA